MTKRIDQWTRSIVKQASYAGWVANTAKRYNLGLKLFLCWRRPASASVYCSVTTEISLGCQENKGEPGRVRRDITSL